MSELLTLGLDEISLDASNPRQNINPERIAELARSIQKHGVIQPIIVRPGGPDETPYVVVAGQRRYLATIEAGKTTIPGIVRDTNGASAAVALVENLQREQLTPVEEAHAFQAAITAGTPLEELAAAVSLSADTIKERLQLLVLPAAVQEKVDGRAVTLGVARSLQPFRAAGDLVVEKVVELLDPTDSYGEPVLPRDLETDAAWVLEQALDELDRAKTKVERPFIVDPDGGGSYRGVILDDLPWPADVDVKALTAKVKQLPEHDGSYRQIRALALKFTDDDYDAARAFGCLLELSSKHDHQGFVTDPVWYADRLDQKLDVAIAKHQKKAAPKKTAGKVATAEAERKERERAEREKEQAAQLAARERNVELGIALFKGLHAPEPTLEAMKLVAGLVLEYAGEDLGRRGLRYIDEESQTVTTRKDGVISRVTHLRGVVECRELLQARIAQADTPQRVLGVLLQAIAAAQYADKTAAATSDRAGHVRALESYSTVGQGEQLRALVEKIAGPHLPASVTKAKAKAKR